MDRSEPKLGSWMVYEFLRAPLIFLMTKISFSWYKQMAVGSIMLVVYLSGHIGI
jgi:hypothetical protein